MVLRDACRNWGARFVAGAAVLSITVFGLCALGIAYPWVLILGGVAVVVGSGLAGYDACKIREGVSITFIRVSVLWIPFAAYLVFYLCHALAPEASPDGAGYHLGL